MYGGGHPENPENQALLVSLFVDQSTPDIQNQFSKHAPGWQGKGIDEIVSITTFVFNGRKDNKEKLRNKQREGKVSLLAAALRGPGPFFLRGRGQGQGRHKPQGLFSPEMPRADCCNYCG